MFITVNGIRMFYTRAGQGPPLVLLHGNGEDHRIFTRLAGLLRRQYTLYMPDSRDHGQSTHTGSIRYADMAADTAAFIRALGLQNPVLVGFSDGGITGLLVAMQQPTLLGGLVCCGANTRPEQLRSWFLAMARFGWLCTHDEKLLLMLTQPDISPAQLANIRTPALVLAGSRDILPTVETLAIAAAIPDSHMQILQGESHSSYIIRRPQVLCRVLLPFLRRVAPTTAKA